MSNHVVRANITAVDDGQYEASVSFINGTGLSQVQPTFAEANDWLNEQISNYDAALSQNEQVGTPSPDDVAASHEVPAEEPEAQNDQEDTNHN